MAEAVYLLCALLSVGCALALLRSYLRGRSRLLLWVSIGFIGFAVNNAILFVDLVMLPTVDLSPARALVSAGSSLVIVIGMMWDVD